MESSLDHLSEALRQVQLHLKDVEEPWLVGGSCGLLLQGVPLQAPPRDLDLYADSRGAAEIHQALLPYSIDRQLEDQSSVYKSILSHYEINGIKVELVCGFEVTMQDSLYKVEAAYLAEEHPIERSIAAEVEPNGDSAIIMPPIKLMPLEHELLFNVLRSRPDRYEAIAVVLRSRSAGMTPTLRDLIRRNGLHSTVIEQLKRLVQANHDYE